MMHDVVFWDVKKDVISVFEWFKNDETQISTAFRGMLIFMKKRCHLFNCSTPQRRPSGFVQSSGHSCLQYYAFL